MIVSSHYTKLSLSLLLSILHQRNINSLQPRVFFTSTSCNRRPTTKKSLMFMSSSFTTSSNHNNNNNSNNNNDKSNTSMKPIFQFTYRLGSSIYIPLTSKCNSKTLPQTRGGKSFLKSLSNNDLLLSLLLVRIAEYCQEEEEVEGYDFINNINQLYNNNNNNIKIQPKSTLEEVRRVKKNIEQIISSWLHDEENEEKNKNDDNVNNNIIMIQDIIKILSSSNINNCKNVNNNSIHEDDMQINTINNNNNDGFYPTVETLFHEVQTEIFQSPTTISSIVFAGEGEPTLRLNAIIALTRLIRAHINSNNITIRVLTNGLMDYSSRYYYQSFISNIDDTDDRVKIKNKENILERMEPSLILLEQLRKAGVDAITVALPTSCPEQYQILMDPKKNVDDDDEEDDNHDGFINDISAHDAVCKFIKNSIDAKFDVEVTGVVREFVDRKQTEELAMKLGVIEPNIRWRSFFT